MIGRVISLGKCPGMSGTMRFPRTALMSIALALGGCAAAPLERAGSLRSYDRMSDANGLVTRSKIRVLLPPVT